MNQVSREVVNGFLVEAGTSGADGLWQVKYAGYGSNGDDLLLDGIATDKNGVVVESSIEEYKGSFIVEKSTVMKSKTAIDDIFLIESVENKECIYGNDFSITELSISNKSLGDVNSCIGYYENLITLRLAYCEITSLPNEISNLINLEWLYFYENLLSSFPIEICTLTNLIYLQMNDNGLTFLPIEIGNLLRLKFLHIHYNNLTFLPAEIGNLVDLKVLSSMGNSLTSIPIEIGNLVNLRTLQIDKNRLTYLPIEIGSLVNLKTFQVGDNLLTSIPAEIGDIVDLEVLYIHDNLLTSIPVKIGNIDKDTIIIGLQNNNFSDSYKEYIKTNLFPIAHANGNLYL